MSNLRWHYLLLTLTFSRIHLQSIMKRISSLIIKTKTKVKINQAKSQVLLKSYLNVTLWSNLCQLARFRLCSLDSIAHCSKRWTWWKRGPREWWRSIKVEWPVETVSERILIESWDDLLSLLRLSHKNGSDALDDLNVITAFHFRVIKVYDQGI